MVLFSVPIYNYKKVLITKKSHIPEKRVEKEGAK